MSSLNFYDKKNDTINKIVIEDSKNNNTYKLPPTGGNIKVYKKRLDSKVVLTVGPGGQFKTLNEAFKEAMMYDVSDFLLSTKTVIEQTNLITIKLKTGFVMKESLTIADGCNYSYITITTETTVICNRKFLQDDNTPTIGYRSFFKALYSTVFPILKGNFKMDETGTINYNQDLWTDHIFLISSVCKGTIFISSGSTLEGGYYVLYCNDDSTILGHNSNYIGNSCTSQVVRIHSGTVDVGRSIIKLKDKNPNLQTVGYPTCIYLSEAGQLRLINTTFESKGNAIINYGFLELRSPVFKNIKAMYAILNYGIVCLANPNTTQMGSSQLTNSSINNFKAGNGVVIQ